MSKLILQIINSLLAVFTILVATLSLIYGINSPIYGEASIPELPVLDSNIRFFGGLALGLGLALLWLTPGIERKGLLFRTIWLCVLLGGIGRIISMILLGLPPLSMVVFTFIEVPLVPVLIYWQKRISIKNS